MTPLRFPPIVNTRAKSRTTAAVAALDRGAIGLSLLGLLLVLVLIVDILAVGAT